MTGDGTRTFEWDAENRLVAINIGANRSEFTYDGADRRVRMVEKESGVAVRDAALLWDGTRTVEERLSTGVVSRFFADGEQHNGAARYLTRDHLGSIREVTDSAAAVVTRNDYDPYGRLTRVAGTEDSRFGYTGHYQHGPSGLVLARYRAYDPTLGRWIGEDPKHFVDGPNLSGYVVNNPIGFVDPDGGSSLAVTGGRLGAGIGASVGGLPGAIVGGIVGGVIGGIIASQVTKALDGKSDGDIKDVPGRPPFTGEPGSTVRGDRQTRRYGPDGYPEADVDTGHNHGQGDPHTHPWDRPKGGGRPTHGNRGPGRPWKPGDPAPPRNAPRNTPGQTGKC